MRRYYEQWEETFDAIRTDVEELIDAGDQVVAVVRGREEVLDTAGVRE